jgi:outer membrane protein
MYKIIIVIVISLITTIAQAQDKPASLLTLKQCVETGISNNLDVFRSGLQVQRSEVDWKQSKLNRMPNLFASTNQGINQGRSIDRSTNDYINERVSFSDYGLNSDVILFNGFSLQNTVKQRQLSMQASKMDYQQAKDDLAINIILAYLLVLNNEDQLQQARNQLDVSKKEMDRLTILDQQGAIPPSQLADLKGQYANDQLSIIDAQAAVATAKISLCQWMNVTYDPSMKLERMDSEMIPAKNETTPEQLFETAVKNFPLVKATELRKQSAEKAIRAVKGELFPTLRLGANIGSYYYSSFQEEASRTTSFVSSDDYVLVNGNPSAVVRKVSDIEYAKTKYGRQLDNNLASQVSLNLSIPIFNKLQTRNRIKQAKINLKENEVTATTTKTQLQQNVHQAHVNVTSAGERYKTLLEQVAAYNESFKAAGARFNAGVGTSNDYLLVKNNLDRANINLINAKYEIVLRTKVLDYYQGKALY